MNLINLHELTKAYEYACLTELTSIHKSYPELMNMHETYQSWRKFMIDITNVYEYV